MSPRQSQPSFKRVRVTPHKVFAGVEVVLPAPVRGRVAVGDHHFADRRAVDQGAPASIVGVMELLEHQSFAGVEAHTQVPPGPGQVIALQGEARALRLRDLDWLQVSSKLAADCRVGVISVNIRDRHGAVVDQVVHPAFFHVDKGHKAINGVRPRVIAGVVLTEAEAAQQPPSFLIWVLEDAR